MKKLQICTFIFDFTDPTIDAREKEIKRATLQELVDYINTGNGKFTEVVSSLLFIKPTKPPINQSMKPSFTISFNHTGIPVYRWNVDC